ncbi:hypothetical protein ElyMa_003055000 [Elysia marginata]|uniref:F5/8 type C domain-containing protein n=1 Tax=Elysia marginata TaxID=1093978 RepID=A0AAV4IK41_9GAST|nr:hypothetical protein ElyMa_003055000 [Elysia marginata]
MMDDGGCGVVGGCDGGGGGRGGGGCDSDCDDSGGGGGCDGGGDGGGDDDEDGEWWWLRMSTWRDKGRPFHISMVGVQEISFRGDSTVGVQEISFRGDSMVGVQKISFRGDSTDPSEGFGLSRRSPRAPSGDPSPTSHRLVHPSDGPTLSKQGGEIGS